MPPTPDRTLEIGRWRLGDLGLGTGEWGTWVLGLGTGGLGTGDWGLQGSAELDYPLDWSKGIYDT